jgi:hypothetical protein
MGIGESDAGGGDRVDVRRRNVGASLTAEVGIPEVIGQYDDDIGPLFGLCGGGGRKQYDQ